MTHANDQKYLHPGHEEPKRCSYCKRMFNSLEGVRKHEAVRHKKAIKKAKQMIAELRRDAPKSKLGDVQ